MALQLKISKWVHLVTLAHGLFCTDKIISTLGEGGMISTNKKKLYEFCKSYINHGTTLVKVIKTLDKVCL